MVHLLKIWPEYFQPILSGAKTVELRSETDRTFAVGDVLRLCEYVPGTASPYTGRTCAVRVTHVLRDPTGRWLAPHVAALSIQRLTPPPPADS
ncbi:DUF3850 domain-containing protein [Sulfobacillus sp. hq2]|uniref:DUF3850 domain-containing protein n=1 Tax=Sulfobacillus sp. hq2 TaxID=2039167 RepID=UPI000CD1C2B7|nr:DUF3850 domain-containing protein [Sulfobacillus sp. hq2]POB12180.1 hypothetical protein CO251_00710 [Sulfobacillus sp. hq2]